ncbi:SRPBCC domain-containing protein [Sphingomonas koreensis]
MTNGTGAGRTDSASRVILATPKTLFWAFVDPEMLASWRAPEGMTARIERFNPAIGGGYRIVLTYDGNGSALGKTSPGEDIADVRFLELDPERRIVEEVQFRSSDPGFAAPMTITTAFEPVRDGTKVTYTASDVPAAIRAEDHEAGMASSLRNLALLTE